MVGGGLCACDSHARPPPGRPLTKTQCVGSLVPRRSFARGGKNTSGNPPIPFAGALFFFFNLIVT